MGWNAFRQGREDTFLLKVSRFAPKSLDDMFLDKILNLIDSASQIITMSPSFFHRLKGAFNKEFSGAIP